MENKEASMRKYDSQIHKLESEWDRLDSMGNQDFRQQKIGKSIEKLRKLKNNWQALWKTVDEVVDVPPAQIQASSTINKDFINYIKNIENGTKSGYKNGKWYPHKSPEGGMPTIGYGHKIKDQSELRRFNGGISDGDVDRLLINDLELAKKKASDDVKHMFKVNIPLDQRQTEMLTDFVFNLGSLTSFPKFTKAVLNKDWKTVEREYRRKYKTPDGYVKDLTQRNQSFHHRFLE